MTNILQRFTEIIKEDTGIPEQNAHKLALRLIAVGILYESRQSKAHTDTQIAGDVPSK